MKTFIFFVLLVLINSPLLLGQWEQTQMQNGLIRSMVTSGNNIFAGMQYDGVYRSTDGGGQWSKTGLNNDSLSNTIVFSLLNKNGKIFAGARNGVYESTDNGINFTRKVIGFPGGGQTTIYSLTLSGNNIIAATTIWYSSSRIDAIFYSTNDGGNWIQALLPVNAVAVTSVTSNGNNVAYAGVYGQSFSTTGLYKSSNSGVTWYYNAFSINADIDLLAVKGTNVLAANLFSAFYSLNSGNTFFPSSPPGGGIYSYTIKNNFIFAGNQEGMFYSTNNGAQWNDANAGFTNPYPIINGSCTNQNYLFAGTENRGIWRINLSYFGISGILTLNLRALIQGFYDPVSNKMVNDSVRVYLRNVSAPYSVIDSARTILDSNGMGSFTFSNAANSVPYYLVIRHRNGLETWSATGNSFTSGNLSYDFTTSSTQAYGNNLFLKGAKYTIYNGDINQEGAIDGSDLAYVDNDAFNFLTGYRITDINGDNLIDGSDLAIVDNNASNFITVRNPIVGDLISGNER